MPRAITMFIGLLGLFAATGCSSSSSSGETTDSGTGVVDSCAPIEGSICGEPCHPGNSLGVGAFCNNFSDCSQLPQAHLCASLGDPNAHFCTFRCSIPPEGGLPEGGDAGLTWPTDCGEGATCTCGGGSNCGCTPNTCLKGG